MILSKDDLLILLDTAYECGNLYLGKFYEHLSEDSIDDYIKLAKMYLSVAVSPIDKENIKEEVVETPVVKMGTVETIVEKEPEPQIQSTPYDYDYEKENDVYYCFYHFSKEDCEKAARRLVPHIIEEYPMIFETPVNMKDVTNLLCEDEPFVGIFFCNYRSMAIMLYRCFDFITWELGGDKNTVKIFYRQLTDQEMSDLRAEGYHIAEAIESYRVFN